MGLDYSETAAIGYFYKLTPEVLKKLEKNLGQAGYDEDELTTYEVGMDENGLRAKRIIEEAGLSNTIDFVAITDSMGNGYEEYVGFVLKDFSKTWDGKYDQGVLFNKPLKFDMEELSKVTSFLSNTIELEPIPLTMFAANIVY